MTLKELTTNIKIESYQIELVKERQNEFDDYEHLELSEQTLNMQVIKLDCWAFGHIAVLTIILK